MKCRWIWTGLFLALGMSRVLAQTNVYVVLNSAFRLTAEVQGPGGTTTTARITTREIVDEIGTATTNHFSPQARLLLFFRDMGGVPFFVIRDGTNEVHVQGFLTATQIGQPITKLNRAASGVVTGTIYVTEEFRLVNIPGLGFDVQGFNTARQSNRATAGQFLPRPGPTLLTVNVAGTGVLAGSAITIRGTMTAPRQSIELRADEKQ
jgi:hypothetical protein